MTLTECPICMISFDTKLIEKHVNDCLKPKVAKRRSQISSSPSSVSSKNVFFGKPNPKRPLSQNENTSPIAKNKKNKTEEILNIKNEVIDNEYKEIEKNENENTEQNGLFKIHSKKLQEIVKGDTTIKEFQMITGRKINIKRIELGKAPLAELMRPTTLDEYYGQQAIETKNLLKESLMNDRIASMILWGPPGCGKTSLAHVIACKCRNSKKYRCVTLSATTSGVLDVKDAVKVAKNEKKLTQRKTVLFIDEIHRFNKLQQDSFLPHVEDGTIVLIGATTENPSFHLNNALISRCRVIVLNALGTFNLLKILTNAVNALNGIEEKDIIEENIEESQAKFILEDGVLQLLADSSNGDARVALNTLDIILQAKVLNKQTINGPPKVTEDLVKAEIKRNYVNYDRKGDEHYDIISALHKSIRGNDENAAIYWLARMLEGGEEPLYIARRLVRCASEDIGLADPNALQHSVSAYQACHLIGMPECSVILAQAVTYLAKAPKSVYVYEGYNKASTVIKHWSGPQPKVPLHLRNAPTKLMKQMGYGKEYKYTPKHLDDPTQDYLPKELMETKFFV